jgi:NCAIR mutase (PurE)-related protein
MHAGDLPSGAQAPAERDLQRARPHVPAARARATPVARQGDGRDRRDIRPTVAEEALETLRALGAPCESIYDVGVAGLHRFLAYRERFAACDIQIVVAGMEGALASVAAGITGKPTIAVPTSVGYGASFGGLAALLGMLNGCAVGVTVVNIDNGFGAAGARRR